MAKKDKAPGREIKSDKKLAGESGTNPVFERGKAFVEERTGSATMINVDGRWDFGRPADPGNKEK